ncbi:hypothetical protein YQE_07821, partial [Dendroctonus ponderosae]
MDQSLIGDKKNRRKTIANFNLKRVLRKGESSCRCRFVLFKKHYDKYLHLSQKYEEARNIAYYLEEKYHEVKTERDDLIQQRERIARRLESNECLLREKEDEVFINLERVVYLEEQCDKCPNLQTFY